MLTQSRVHTTLPAQDLARARTFYEDTLGFTPTDVNPGGVRYFGADGTTFVVFSSSGLPSGNHTQIGFGVSDIHAEVADLKARGVVFEAYDFPGFDAATSVAQTPAGPAAWFKDTEGNLLGLLEYRP